MKTALVFDIDGTLIDSEHIDAYYFIRALKDILGTIGIADDWSSYTKVTDIGIVTEILEQNNLPATDAIIGDIREHFRKLLTIYFDNGGKCPPIPGVPSFLSRLHDNREISCGIATGGWETTARMKLSYAEIDISTMPLSSSDDGNDRPAIMMNCLKKMAGPFDRTIYIGDGIWDLNASADLGWEFIGIGSKLKGQCEHWFDNFSDIPALMRILLR